MVVIFFRTFSKTTIRLLLNAEDFEFNDTYILHYLHNEEFM